jgi:zinc transporter, ZIP family
VSPLQTIALGAVAGMTILLGMPIGRLKDARPGLRTFLNAVAVGILVFILYDVLAHALAPISLAISPSAGPHTQDVAKALGLTALLFLGLATGLLGLVGVDTWLIRSRRPKGNDGPGAALASAAVTATAKPQAFIRDRSHEIALFIAMGIGLHNFAEGLAIGQSAARGAIGFAVVLVVGFAVHNATEGFGITAPMAGDAERPTWAFLIVMAVIGGGPTILGTAVGRFVTSEAVSVAFLALAAGSILYVVVQLIKVSSRRGHSELFLTGILAGLAMGVLTDLIVTAGGA